MVIYSMVLIGGKGIAADKLDGYPTILMVINAYIILS